METTLRDQLVATVRQAQDGHHAILKLTETLCPGLTVAEAYEVQRELLRQKVADGDSVVAPKMGLTSPAKLQQMGVEEPVYGFLTRSMLVAPGGVVHLANYIHPKAEPEIGVVLRRDLAGEDLTPAEVAAAVELVFPAIEIIDSRYEQFRFTVPDVIADNTSAAGAVLGASVAFTPGLDLRTMRAVLRINGEERAAGLGEAVLGDPLASIVCLARMLAQCGEVVRAGQPIITGGITAAVPLQAGDSVEVEIECIGRTGFVVAR